MKAKFVVKYLGISLIVITSFAACNNKENTYGKKGNPHFVEVKNFNLCIDTATMDFYAPHVQLSAYHILDSSYNNVTDSDLVTITFKTPNGYSCMLPPQYGDGPFVKSEYYIPIAKSKKIYIKLKQDSTIKKNNIITVPIYLPIIDIKNGYEFIDIRVDKQDTSIVKGRTVVHRGYVKGTGKKKTKE